MAETLEPAQDSLMVTLSFHDQKKTTENRGVGSDLVGVPKDSSLDLSWNDFLLEISIASWTFFIPNLEPLDDPTVLIGVAKVHLLEGWIPKKIKVQPSQFPGVKMIELGLWKKHKDFLGEHLGGNQETIAELQSKASGQKMGDFPGKSQDRCAF